MTLKGHDTRDIFPDFRTYIHPPVNTSWFYPKAWGHDAIWTMGTGVLTDLDALFITNDVQIGDSISVLDGDAMTTNVAFVFFENTIITAVPPDATYPVVRYKVGHGPAHTIQTLAHIVGQRAITYATIHHGKVWTGALHPHWNTDHTGEVYVISHDTKKARWLDGEIDLPVCFPEDPELPPKPLNISAWETRFPGLPRPDYPPGLEPGGDLRAALISEHGSLLQAEEA